MELKLREEILQPKFKGLDGLRGIAVLLVIISHVSKPYTWTNSLGKVGVNIFFVLSGFLITTLLLKEKVKYGRISLKDFYIRRGLRIIPVVYLYLLFLFLLNIVYELKVSGKFFITSALFVRNLPLFQGTRDWYTEHFWTIGIEEQFYLIWPIVISRIPLRYIKPLILAFCIFFTSLAYIYFQKLDLDTFHVSTSTHIALGIVVNLFGKGTALILTGCLFSILYLEKNKLIELLYKFSHLCSFVLLSVAVLLASPFVVRVISFSELLFALVIAMLLVLNLKENSLLCSFLEMGILKQIGILSYSLYVWQQLFTRSQPWFKGNDNYSTIIFNLLLLAVVACLSYYLYERKFLKWKERFKKV